MKKIVLIAIAICGIQIASAQTLTPSSTEKKQQAPVPGEKKKSDRTMPAEKRSGSTGTYTTGADVPSDLPADTAMDSNRKPRPIKKPDGNPRD